MKKASLFSALLLCVYLLSAQTAFVNTTTNGEWTSRVQEFISNFRKQDEMERLAQQQTMSRTVNFMQLGSPLNRFIYKRKRRRF